MSADGSHNGGGNGDTNPRHRRSSITQAALSNLFQRGPSNSSGPPFPGQVNSDPQRRRLSVTTVGLSGASASGASALGIRRGSMSTNSNNSDSIDECAIEEDDMVGGPRTAPTTPYTARRMSYGGSAIRGFRPGSSPNGNIGPISSTSQPSRSSTVQSASLPRARGSNVSTVGLLAGRRTSVGIPPTTSVSQASNTMHSRIISDSPSRPDQQGFNWSEQLRSRAESTVAGGSRPSFSLASSSPPRTGAMHHDRTKSVSDMPQPPVQAPAPKPERKKPDAFQERILKGDFYMD